MIRYDANPCAAYSDERIEPILKNIEAIGLNLKGYEDIKWKQMMDHSFDIFQHDYKKRQEVGQGSIE